MSTPALSARRRILAQTCLTLALLVLLAASAGMVLYLLSLGRNTRLIPESVFGILILWPPLMVLSALLGGVGLLAARQRRALWLLCGAAVLLVVVPLGLALDGANRLGAAIPNTITVVTNANGDAPIMHTITQGDAPVTHGPYIPFTGSAVGAIIALFASVNAVALYGGWRVMRSLKPMATR